MTVNQIGTSQQNIPICVSTGVLEEFPEDYPVISQKI